MPVPLLLAAAPGLIKAAGSLFGGRKRRENEKNALAAQKSALNAVNNFQYTQGVEDPYANFSNAAEGLVTNTAAGLTNPFQDLKVNTQQAEFQAEQNSQNQANILDALVQGGGNPAVAATQLAQQATNANAQISADIGRQEAANQQLAAQGEAQRQQAFAAGESRRQGIFLGEEQRLQQAQAQGSQYVQAMNQMRDDQRQSQNLFNLGRADKNAAQATAARTAARNQLIGGLSSAAGAFAGGGGFGSLGGGGSTPNTSGGGISGFQSDYGMKDYSNFGSQYDLSVPNLTGN